MMHYNLEDMISDAEYDTELDISRHNDDFLVQEGEHMEDIKLDKEENEEMDSHLDNDKTDDDPTEDIKSDDEEENEEVDSHLDNDETDDEPMDDIKSDDEEENEEADSHSDNDETDDDPMEDIESDDEEKNEEADSPTDTDEVDDDNSKGNKKKKNDNSDKKRKIKRKIPMQNKYFRVICRICGYSISFNMLIPRIISKKFKKIKKIVYCPNCYKGFKVAYDKNGNIIVR